MKTRIEVMEGIHISRNAADAAHGFLIGLAKLTAMPDAAARFKAGADAAVKAFVETVAPDGELQPIMFFALADIIAGFACCELDGFEGISREAYAQGWALRACVGAGILPRGFIQHIREGMAAVAAEEDAANETKH